MLDDINESMSEIDLADYAQGLVDGDTLEKGEVRPDKSYPPSPHQLGSYYGIVVFYLHLLPYDYLLTCRAYINDLLGESENDL